MVRKYFFRWFSRLQPVLTSFVSVLHEDTDWKRLSYTCMEPHQGTGKHIGHWVQILEEDGISAALSCSLTTLGTWTTFFPLGSVAKDKYLFWRKTSFSFKKKIFCFSHDPNMCLVTPCWTQLSCFAPSPPSLLADIFLGTEKAFFCLSQRIEPYGQKLGNLLRTVPLSFHQESRLILRWICCPEVRS